MEETDQFNIRLPKTLIYDLEFVSQHSKLNRNDWVRFKLAELITKERQYILDSVSSRFIRGLIGEGEFREKTGINPTEDMLESRERVMQAQQEAKKSQEKYFMEIAQRAQKQDLGHFDRYFTKIIKKTNAEKKKGMKKEKSSK